jgi:two-component system NtrC family sensor kinase
MKPMNKPVDLADAAMDMRAAAWETFTTQELLHFSRLITIGELSSCFAHEVTNPLTMIKGHLRFIDESLAADHPLRANFEVVERASRRIEEIARRMLDFSKKKTGGVCPCELGDLIPEALRFFEPYSRTNFIDVQLDISPDLPIIFADRGQILQVIINLLQNAADAMAESNRRVLCVRAEADRDRVRISISDIGVGIAPENLPKIFEPFFTTKGAQVTGLGLYITKQVIEEHRGEIEVQTDSCGSTFVISLPL